MTTESKIIHSRGGMMLVGPDAVELFAAATLRSAIGLLTKGIQPTRGFTMKRALERATRYSGVKYKRTEAERAIRDLDVWISTMKSALPEETRS